MGTKLGLHVTQGSRNGYGEVVAAAPAVVIAVGEGGAVLEAREKSGGRTITIFREQTVFHDAPQGIDQMSEAEVRATARGVWPLLRARYAANPADYYQPVNETGGDNPTSLRNIIAFEMELMALAEQDGLKLAVGSPAGGSPGSWDLWVQFYVPLLRRAAQGGHIYSRHAYGGVVDPNGPGTLTLPGPVAADDNAGRPFREAAYLREQGIVTPMVITEAGPNGGFRFPGADGFVEDMIRYDQLCQQHENIWGFCCWTYGRYQNFPANIEDASGRLADYLRQQGGATRPVYPTISTGGTDVPTDTNGEFRFTHWPTEHRSITQFYNNNPEFYSQFGPPNHRLTGHEGVDIVAPLNSAVFAVADGTVYLVRSANSGHEYGNAIYIRHQDGYRTAYAHLKEVHVDQGAEVVGGQIIGLADSTGNVIPKPTPANPGLGAHLHLTLYKEGATARGETQQPLDIIDPTPFLAPLREGEWTPPAGALVSGWGIAASIERRAPLGRISAVGGINLRAQPDQNATKLGLIPEGTIVRLSGGEQNGYLALQVAEAELLDRPVLPAGDAAEAAGFTSNVNLDQVAPGQNFQATWTFRNTGQTTWNSDYRISYTNQFHPETAGNPRSPMSTKTSFTFAEARATGAVQPGQSVSLTIPLTAPLSSATHATNWQLHTPSRQPFGPVRWLRAVILRSLSREFVSFTNSAGDFSNVQPGRQFTATWVIANSGTESWTGDFRLVYVDSSVPETQSDQRSRLGAPASFTLRDLGGVSAVRPGERVTLPLQLVAPQQAGWYASHWQLQSASGVAIGPPLWLRIGVPQSAPPPPPPPTGLFQPGMNINPDAHPADIERLRGLKWVRFVYKAAAKRRNVDQAFQDEYRALIQGYVNAGIRCLLVLNQETEWGNGPWDNGNWPAYAGALGRAARRVAELCQPFGDKVAFQIWNEEDSGQDNPSAIGVAAEDFAVVLDETAKAIRQAAPNATIIIGGLNTGPQNAIAYVKRIQQKLGGRLPVSALAYHPYGRYVNNDPFYGQQFGKLQDALRLFRESFPDVPLWITEMGVADNNPIGAEHYQKIANYMREIVNEVAANHARNVPVLIWFAWSDLMRNAGITTVGGELKPHIGDAFREMVARGQAAVPAGADALDTLAAARTLERSVGARSAFVRFETTLENYKAVPAGSSFTNRWVFRNTSDTTWGDGYRLVHTPSGANSHPLASAQSFNLSAVAQPFPVQPGQEVTITLNMTAPEPFGREYHSRWELRDPAGNDFGHLYAEITVVRPPSAGTGAQHANMIYIADHTVPDDTRFPEGTSFLKQWQVRNNGARQWGTGFRLVFMEGELTMSPGMTAHVVPPAKRDEVVILSVPMVAPVARGGQPTTYSSLWRMQDDRGNLFGDTLWARIISLPPDRSNPPGRFSDPAGWYSQIDPRWQGIRLGHSQQTIGTWGCLLTAYAMMLHGYGVRLNPAELNARLQQIGDDGFRGANVQFIAPTRVLAGLVHDAHLRMWSDSDIPFSTWVENPLGRVDAALAAGQAVLAQVDREPNNGYYHSSIEQHWVILLARTPAGDDYYTLDPMVPADMVRQQPGSLMAKYGSPAPSRPHDENLRNAIKSVLIYRYVGGAAGG